MVAAFRERMRRGLIGIKLDADGCFLDDGQISATVPAYKIDCVDTTGAGDTWFGALMTALRKSMPLDRQGSSRTAPPPTGCTAFGASAGVRSFEETLKRL
jgi:sugar/nucleoside kinase (ribokinase family)